MASTSDWDSVLLTDGEGAVYRVPLADLAKYQLPPSEAEEILEGDVVGFAAPPPRNPGEPPDHDLRLLGYGHADGTLHTVHATGLGTSASASAPADNG